MTNHPDASRRGEVIPDGDHATIVFKRILRHSPDRIWESLTSPDDLKQWLMCTSTKIDGRNGGSVDMLAGPSQLHVTGKILTWDPPRVYEHEWNVKPVKQMPQGENAVFRYELEPRGESTLMTVTYRRLTAETARGFAAGTHVLLDRLEAQLAGAPLPDWMPCLEELMALYPGLQK